MNFLEGVQILGEIFTGKSNNINNQPKKELSSNTSIYNSNRLNKGLKRMNDMGKKRKELSRNPVKTGIINKVLRHPGSNRRSILKNNDEIEHFGNVVSDSEFSDDSSIASAQSTISVSNDPNLLINQSQKLLDNRYHERQFQNKNVNDSFLNQYEPMKYDMKTAPSSANAVQRSDSGVDRLQTERSLAMQGGYSNFGDDLTLGVVPENQLIHNNMIPQFKSKTYGSNVLNAESRNAISQRKMETFTGNLADTKIHKTEQKPLFSPLLGITNIYGTPSITNMVEDRYMPGRERKNELPFRQERITTGLNLGYNEVNKNGDNFRALPKTIDEMRTLDRQQKTYTLTTVDGMKGTRGPVIGDVKKYRPERTKYWGDDRLVPSLGYIRAPAIYGEVNAANLGTINRGTTDRTMLGPAQTEVQQATPDSVREKYKVDLKQNFKQAEPRNIMLVEGLQAREDSKKYIPDPTQRSQTLDYTGPLGTSQVSKGVAFDMITNIFDMTKRALTEVADRYGAATTGDYKKMLAEDFTDVMDPTRRNIIDKYDRYGNGITGDYIKPKYYDPTDVTKTTMRNIHDKTDRAGFLGGDRGGNYTVDFKTMTPDPTMRDIHDKTDRAGFLGGDRGGNYTVDFKTMTPDPTMRDIHDKTDRAGFLGGDRGGNYTVDFKTMTPDPTMRDIHDKNDRAGVAMSGDRGGNYTVDFKTMTPDPTMRDIHDKNDRAGVAMSGERGGNYTIDFKTMTPDPTMRDIHDKNDRAGVAMSGERGGNYTIDFKTMTPDLTMRDIHDKTDRAGIITGDKGKGYTINYIDYTPDQTMREIHSKLDRSAAGANGVYLATRTRDDALNSQVNKTREVIAKGRAPTNSKYNKGPTMDFTTVSLCDPIQIKRDLLSSTIAINEKLPFILTQTPTGRMVTNTRINEFTEKVLEKNPYINNVVHQYNNSKR